MYQRHFRIFMLNHNDEQWRRHDLIKIYCLCSQFLSKKYFLIDLDLWSSWLVFHWIRCCLSFVLWCNWTNLGLKRNGNCWFNFGEKWASLCQLRMKWRSGRFLFRGFKSNLLIDSMVVWSWDMMTVNGVGCSLSINFN